MEYIKSLGFDSIWLSPIFAVGSIALGDDVTDFKKYNPELGTDEQFQAFFEAVSGMGELDLVLCPTEWLLFSLIGIQIPIILRIAEHLTLC